MYGETFYGRRTQEVLFKSDFYIVFVYEFRTFLSKTIFRNNLKNYHLLQKIVYSMDTCSLQLKGDCQLL